MGPLLATAVRPGQTTCSDAKCKGIKVSVRPHVQGVGISRAPAEHAAHAAINVIAQASPSGAALDKSGLASNLESGLSASLAGGLESGLAWADGYTFIGLQDRGPNAKPRNEVLDDTTSFIGRFQSLRLQPNANAATA